MPQPNERRVRVAALALSLLFVASLAHAQATRTWVSGVGNDANPCSRTAPCKTFAGAFPKTAAGGEISALDPGGFGSVTITKSITISGDGTLAGILAAGTNGVIVSAGAADKVALRGLSIHGAGNGLNAIRYLSGGQLVVENCSISGFATHGIDANLGANSGQLSVVNTTFSNINTVAVRVAGTAGTQTTTLDNVRIHRAGFGVDILRGTAAVARSLISNVTNQAIVAEGSAVINVDDTVITDNGTGVSALATGSTVRLANVAILQNGVGINVAAGATVASFGGNKNAGNTTPGAPNLNLVLQ